MRLTRPVLTGIAIWLLVVAVGSTLVWVVISRAGDGVVSSEAPVPTTTDRAGQTPDRTPGPTADPSSSPSDEPATADPVRRTWQGVGGQVTVECQGTAASFVNAIPDGGFGFEIDDRGPGRVRVEFEQAGDGARSRIEASCVDGTPVFGADIDSD